MDKGMHFTVKTLTGISVAILFLVFGTRPVAAQSDVQVDLVLAPRLEKAQVINLTSLGIGNKTSGQKVYDLVLQNNSPETVGDLYLNITFRSDRIGVIADFFQEQGSPFSMDAGQLVTADNNQLDTGIPGIEEDIDLDGGLTDAGEQFINGLEGSTKLPSDTYTVELSIFQGNNSRNGGELLSQVTRSVGSSISENVTDLYLVQPGDAVGSDAVINTNLPVFRWEGPFDIKYRLIVVRDNGQDSPESLLQAAKSSEATLDNGVSAMGSLLEYEMVDARVNGNSFTMPPNGVQTLEPGGTYYWQVTAVREAVSGTDNIESEIWAFSVAEDANVGGIVLNSEVKAALRELLGPQRYKKLNRKGFQLLSISVDGQTLQGAAAIQKLVELRNKVNNGEITVPQQ